MKATTRHVASKSAYRGSRCSMSSRSCQDQLTLPKCRSMFQVYLPSCMFVIVSWVSFMVKPEVVPGRWILFSKIELFSTVCSPSPSPLQITNQCVSVTTIPLDNGEIYETNALSCLQSYSIWIICGSFIFLLWFLSNSAHQLAFNFAVNKAKNKANQKDTKKWYTIDALGAIFTMFTIIGAFPIFKQHWNQSWWQSWW